MKFALYSWLILLTLPQAVEAASVVVPNEDENVEGNQANIAPFGIVGTNFSMRYQQVYDASQFSKTPDGGWITEIAFRVDATFGTGFDAILTNIQINLSTTSKAVDSLSPVFSANVGADDTVVFGPGSLRIGSGFFHSGLPQPFEVYISFTKPFLYRPSAGNLLLDVRNFQGLPFFAASSFDAQDLSGDSVSRVYADSVGALSANHIDSFGLVALFEITPVPEPGIFALLLPGTIILGIFDQRKLKKLTTCFSASDE